MEEYIIFGYMGDLEDAMMSAKNNGIGGETIKEIESVHDELGELGPLLNNEADYKRLKEDAGGLIESIVKNAGEGNKDNILGCVRELRDKLKIFKTETFVL